MATFINPYTYISDPTRGRPVFNGRVYLGNPDTDPTQPENQIPVSVVQENGTLTQIEQPIRTGPGGVATFQGNPVQLDVQIIEHSMTIEDANGRQVYYSPRISLATIGDVPTDLINQFIQYGYPRFITSAQNNGNPVAYNRGAVVVYNAGAGDRIYESLSNGNTTLPTDTDNWRLVDQRGRDAFNDNLYMQKTRNLSDLTNVVNARTNLGLGDAALRTVGTASNNLIENSRFSQSFNTSGRVTLPNGFILQWLSRATIGAGSTSTRSWPIAFPNACRFAVCEDLNRVDNILNVSFSATPTRTSCRPSNQGGGSTKTYWVYAVGN